MSKYFFTILILIIAFKPVQAQDLKRIPVLDKKDLSGTKVIQSRSFAGESLYGYIDGGADLYLEYGFSGLTVTYLSEAKSKIKIEVWRMDDPESAFGIFSVSRFRCKSKPDFTDLACQNKYQLQFCKSDFYVNIINEKGSPSDSVVSIRLGKLLAGKISENRVDLRGYFQEMDMKTILNESVLVKGRLGINNGVSDLEPYFRESGDFKALILVRPDKFIVSMKFRSQDLLEKFGELHKWESMPLQGKTIVMKSGETVLRKGNKEIVVEIPAGSQNGVLVH